MKRMCRYGLALCVLILSGCVAGMKTDRLPVNIGFHPVIGHDTRAVEESIPFPEDRTFNVWAVRADNGAATLSDETITYGFGGWTASKVWPETDLMFAAYYPSDLNPEYRPGHGFILRDFNASADDNDVLIAQEYIGGTDPDGLVPLHFSHILSRVDFRVLHSLSDGIEVKAMKVEMVGFGMVGDYNVKGDHKWEIDSEDDSLVAYDADGDNGVIVTGEAKYIGGEFFTVPQYSRAEIIVTFNVRVGNGDWVVDEVSAGKINTDWQPGTLYTYTLNLTDTKLTYTTGITSWTSK